MAKNENKKAVKLTKVVANNQNSTSSNKIKNKDVGSAGGIDEIDSLFSEKRKHDRQAKKKEEDAKAAKKARYKSNKDNGGGSSTSFHRKHIIERNDEWVDDGLGGKYNKEGYTGRVEDGIKIFKAH